MYEPMASGIWDYVKFGQMLLFPSHIIYSSAAMGAVQLLDNLTLLILLLF